MNTPESDRNKVEWDRANEAGCAYDFARKLERQRDEARKELAEERTVADHLAAALRGEYSKWEALKAWEARLENPPPPVFLQNRVLSDTTGVPYQGDPENGSTDSQ